MLGRLVWRARGRLAALSLVAAAAGGPVLLAQPGGGDDRPAAPPAAAGATAPAKPSGPLSRELQSQLAAVGHEVQRLRQAGDAAAAEELAAQLQHFRDRADGKAASRGEGPEVHVVGLYEGELPAGLKRRPGAPPPGQPAVHPVGTAVVELHPTDRPVVLVLCAYEPVKWELRPVDGAKPHKLILAGYYDQQVAGLPDGVPVEHYSHEGGGSADYFYVYSKDLEAFPRVVRTVRRLTGLHVCTFQGRYAYKGKPLVVGPPNGDWQTQRLLNDLRPVYLAAVAHERARRREAVAAVRFTAMHQTWVDEHQVAGSVGDFTPAGPVADTLRPLPSHVSHVAVDPEGPTHYSMTAGGLARLDLKAGGRPVRIPEDPALPKLSWSRGLAFDTKRRRLVLASFDGGGGRLYAYHPGDAKWTFLGEVGHIDLQSL